MTSVLGPALAMLQIGDIPAGYAALDALTKEAPVSIVHAGTVQCGHFLVIFAGEVEAVELSFARAVASSRAKDALIDAVLLPHAEKRILPALRHGTVSLPDDGDTLGVVQTGASPTLLRAIDAALKGARVDLVELRTADGLGGRGLATLWGLLPDVEAAIDLAKDAFARGRPEACTTALIPNADPEVARAIGGGTRFFKEFRG
jgi:microcompartment protein CcmL/EutN